MREQTLEAALHLYALGYNVLPMWRGKKVPCLPEWRTRQMCRLNRVELRSLFLRKDCDPAILCGELAETTLNIVGLDFDSLQEFQHWQGPGFNQLVKSPHGFHAYGQLAPGIRWPNAVKLGGRPLDIRHHGGLLKCPPAASSEGMVYEWVCGPVPARELVLLDPGLFEQLAGCTRQHSRATDDGANDRGTGCLCDPVRAAVTQTHANCDRVAPLTPLEWRCLQRLAPSIQGLNGSRACIIAGLKLLTLTGGHVPRTWELLVAYNRTRCAPPWEEVTEKGPDSLPRKLSESLRIWLRRRNREGSG